MIKLLPLCAFLFCLFSCSTYKIIDIRSDKNYDFKKINTFAWAPDKAENEKFNNKVLRDTIRNSVTADLNKIGQKLDAKKPDVLIDITLINVPDCGLGKEESFFQGVPSSESYNKYYSRFNYKRRNYYVSPPPLYSFTSAYVTGQLNTVDSKISISILDPESHRVLWSSASEVDYIEPELTKQIAPPAIKKMLVKGPLKKRHHYLFHHRS